MISFIDGKEVTVDYIVFTRMHHVEIPEIAEIEWAKRFLDTLADEYGSSLDDLAVWTDLCHTIYNRKEFIYVF